jgi:hypothetical protein
MPLRNRLLATSGRRPDAYPACYLSIAHVNLPVWHF